jgi:hypothetical protein
MEKLDKLEQAMIQLRSPDMRTRLIEYLKDLSDIDYQKNHWGVFDEKSGTYDELDSVVHFLFDETALASDPAGLIGWSLYSIEEAVSIRKLSEAFDTVFKANGLNLSDQEYLVTQEWPLVLQAASDALSMLNRGLTNDFS